MTRAILKAALGAWVVLAPISLSESLDWHVPMANAQEAPTGDAAPGVLAQPPVAERSADGSAATAAPALPEIAEALAAAQARRVRAVEQSPIVVELFTSQGCSSCPPADELLAEIAPRDDLIALALHVDYWDYLGWEDPFAQPAFTARQKAYARAKGERTIYTPQMIVNGAEALVGPEAETLEALVTRSKAAPDHVGIAVSGMKGKYEIELWANPPLDHPAVVQIVRYAPEARVKILRGENAGLELDYANVVTAWHAVAEWDGRTPQRITATIEGNEPAVVIVQAAYPGKKVPLPGAILAAERLTP
ncbi:DUF1223 domain-containing protein [Pseudothioclava nitratireducens]|uniref:DUF1223 domain-containing protein n=1 Tax=Pseudothioclava nitratireducens TaxID=1928646 RepID=UPI0023DB22B7|nr:DUF1223 domain-containing protein [Defluviimonas nitratireducens]MDF1620012.1 DUF1223 domain-containing protein [Defluviimonas nitratireducens]